MEQTQILTPRIGSEEIRRAAQILKKYREGKIQLERRIIDNEQFWKLRHWQQMEKEGRGGNRTIRSRRAAGSSTASSRSTRTRWTATGADGAPARAGRPRGGSEADADSAGDSEEEPVQADVLVGVVVQAQVRVRGVRRVLGRWEARRAGDISIRRMDLLNLFWEPGVTDVQDSEHFFLHGAGG